jgi:hypothetical protein
LWHAIPWLDPITHEEYPEIRNSMLKIKQFEMKRKEHDQKKAEAETKWKHK